jgi:hypothetical protein
MEKINLRHIAIFLHVSILLSFSNCTNEKVKSHIHKEQIQDKVDLISNTDFKSIDECVLLTYMLSEGCLKYSARLSHDSLKVVRIVFPDTLEAFVCDQLRINDVSVQLKFEAFDLNVIKHVKSTPNNPLRTFYLLKSEMSTSSKVIELFYGPSNSIYRLKVNKVKAGVEFEDLICANF